MLWTIVVLLLILWLLGFLRLIGYFAIELVAFTTDRHQVHVHTTSWFPLHRENTMLPGMAAVPGAAGQSRFRGQTRRPLKTCNTMTTSAMTSRT